MINPNDNNIVPDDTGLNTENPSSEPMNLNEAGRLFFDALNIPPETEKGIEGELPPEEGAANVIPQTEDIPPQVDANTLESIKESILAEIQSLKQSEVPPVSEEPTEETPEQNPLLDMTDEDFMEKFSENPLQTVMELADSIANQKVQTEMMALAEKMKPLLDKSEELAFEEKVKATLAEFTNMEEFSDAEKYFPQMAEAIKTKGLPTDDINTFINTYKDAALQDARTNQGKSLDEYLADDNELGKVIENPKVKEAIIKQYLQEIASGGKPQVISSGGTTTPAATPPTQFKTFKEAGNAFKQQL